MQICKYSSSVFLALSLLVLACTPIEAAKAASPQANYTLVKKGYEQIQQGLYMEAVKTLCQAVQVERNNIVARRYLAYALTEAGSHQSAIEQLELIGKMGELSAFDQYLYGNAYYAMDKFAQAKDAYEKAIALSPNFDAARGGLIKSLVKLSQFEQAKTICMFGLQQAKTDQTRQYYQTILATVQEVNASPSAGSDSLQFSPGLGTGNGPVSLGARSSE
jgi:tetratricopeptide (TPR) repeat protein